MLTALIVCGIIYGVLFIWTNYKYFVVSKKQEIKVKKQNSLGLRSFLESRFTHKKSDSAFYGKTRANYRK